MRLLRLFKESIQGAKHVLISTHLFPDADGIGSQVALSLALRKLGIDALAVNEEKLLDRYDYLTVKNLLLSHREYARKSKREIDLFIVVDANNAARIGAKMNSLMERSKRILYIDHHPCPKPVETLHCVDTSKAATGQIVGELIEELGISFDPKIALALYTAILIDTSSFRYPTVKGDTHKLVGRLLDTGISPHIAYNQIYGTKKISHMRLLGTILKDAQTTPDQQIAWILLPQELIDRYKADVEDTHAFINHLLVLDNIKIACMFRELGDKTKISFRSSGGDTDVGAIAEAFGGGGHNHSAATIVDGKIQDVVKSTIKKLQLILKSII